MSARPKRDWAGPAGYEEYQRRIRKGRAPAAGGPRPTEFDANGFPVPQRNPSFVERVARLLNPL